MLAILPPTDAPAAAWRAAAAVAVRNPIARAVLLGALPARGDGPLVAALPTLLARARGPARLEVARAAAALAAHRALPPPAVFALLSALHAAAGPARTACAAALRALPPDTRAAVDLSLSLSARVPAARGGGARELAALAAWVRAGGDDPLSQCSAPSSLWRAWLAGASTPSALEHALVLSAAGARPAACAQLAAASAAVVERVARPSPSALALLRWLAEECVRADAAPPSAAHAAWIPAAAHAHAASLLAEHGPVRALAVAAAGLGEAPLGGALALALVRLCARRGAPPALAADALADALAVARAEDPAYPALVAVLLGRGAAPPLPASARARVAQAALANPALGALTIALADLEVRGVPPALVPALRTVARTSPDAVSRQHARQLARGEHL